MGGKKNYRRPKKTIEKASRPVVKPKEKEEDISALPVETDVGGAQEIAAVLETGTNEAKHMINNECDIIFQCKVCRSIYRYWSDFLMHKRKFCIKKFKPACFVDDFETEGPSDEQLATQNSEVDEIVERLSKFMTMSETAKGSLKERNVDDIEGDAPNFSQMDTNDHGTFQTCVDDTSINKLKDIYLNNFPFKLKELTTEEIMENYRKIHGEATVLDPKEKVWNNKLHEEPLLPECNFPCVKCSEKFATQKLLDNHVECVHHPKKTPLLCPVCQETLSNPWSAFRHQIEVHRMTCQQFRQIREHGSSYIYIGSQKNKMRSKPTQSANDRENQRPSGSAKTTSKAT